ncbi:MAG: response regulator transcription factor [Microbacter sp.]
MSTEKNELYQVAVAEPFELIRKGLIALLKQSVKLKMHFTEIETPDELFMALKTHTFHLLFINPLFFGYDVRKKIRNCSSSDQLKIVAVSSIKLNNALQSQFDASLSVYDNAQTLANIVASLNLSSTSSTLQHPALSLREQEIIILVVKGLTNKEIANRLFISTHTVMAHRRNIAKKLQIHSTAGLTIFAIVNKLVSLEEIQQTSLS